MFFSYNAVSQGKSFLNIKFASLKQNTSSQREPNEETGSPISAEWNEDSRTMWVPLLKNSTSMRSHSFGMCYAGICPIVGPDLWQSFTMSVILAQGMSPENFLRAVF